MPTNPAFSDAQTALGGLRDTLRSARFWRELLTDADRQALLGDIARVALLIGGDLFPDQHLGDIDALSAAESGDLCPRERLYFLQTAWPRMASAWQAIEESGPPALREECRTVALHRARKITPKDFFAAVRGGDFAPVDAGLGLPYARLPRTVCERFSTPTWDTGESRVLKTMLAAISRDLAGIADLARVCGKPEVERDALRLRVRVKGVLRREAWRDLPPAPRILPLPDGLRHSGPHRLLHDTFARYRRNFALDWHNPIFTLPARETWQVYEIWCFFTVARVLRDLGFRANSADNFTLATGGLTFRLATGSASRITFCHAASKQTVHLTYNHTFPRAGGSGGETGSYSRSFALRPDITLESPNGDLLILDAKFKTYAQVGWERADIAQMHTYRDAIAHNHQRNIVRAAWLLFAGKAESTAGENRTVIAYPRATPAAPWGTGDVGALCLRPGVKSDGLKAWLRDFLSL